jgi:hypothetical protein
MSVVMLCVGIAGAGYGIGVYTTGTDDRIGRIEKTVNRMEDDLKAIKNVVGVRKARF